MMSSPSSFSAGADAATAAANDTNDRKEQPRQQEAYDDDETDDDLLHPPSLFLDERVVQEVKSFIAYPLKYVDYRS